MSSSEPRTGIAVIQELFSWYNQLIAERRQVNRADMERFFTPDAVMIANNRVKCRGIDAHLLHFHDLAEQMHQTELQPPDIVLSTPARAAAYYRINFVAKNGTQGTVYDMAIWDFVDGKIQRMTEIIHVEGAQIDLKDF
jgi:hypothetical protein